MYGDRFMNKHDHSLSMYDDRYLKKNDPLMSKYGDKFMTKYDPPNVAHIHVWLRHIILHYQLVFILNNC